MGTPRANEFVGVKERTLSGQNRAVVSAIERVEGENGVYPRRSGADVIFPNIRVLLSERSENQHRKNLPDVRESK